MSVTPGRQGATFDLPSGTTLGKYEVLRKIATGGMAEIYLARVRGTAGFEKLVVLKRILPNVAEDPTFVQMFLDEARLAATLVHPNIADVYDVGDDAGAPFFAMEFIHGQDVRGIRMAARKRGETIPLSISLAITHGLAAALDYAHDKTGPDGAPLRLVHRDVSASNVIVSYDGAIKLLDFGIARATGRTHKTQIGTLKGKIPYMSPEQCRGHELDRRSDLFSLGVVMYELTVGRRPFRGESDFEMMDQIVNKGALAPSTVIPDYPPELEAIVMKLLAMKPENRYQTAEEMIQDLEPFLSQHRLWVSSKPLGKYMRSLFADKILAWESAQQEGVPLSQHVAMTITSQSQQSELLVTPASAFPGLHSLSKEMPAMVGQQMPAVRPPISSQMPAAPRTVTSSLPGVAPMSARDAGDVRIDSSVSQTVYPELRTSRKPMTFVLLGVLALALGGVIAVVMSGGSDKAHVDDRAAKPGETVDTPVTGATDPVGANKPTGEGKPTTETNPTGEGKPTRATNATSTGNTTGAANTTGASSPAGAANTTGTVNPTAETKPVVDDTKPVVDDTKPVVTAKPVIKPTVKPTVHAVVKPVVRPVVKPVINPVVKPVVKPKEPDGKGSAWDPNSPFLPGG